MKSLVQSSLEKFGYKLSKVELVKNQASDNDINLDSSFFKNISPVQLFFILDQIGYFQDKINFSNCFEYNSLNDNFTLMSESTKLATEILNKYKLKKNNLIASEPLSIEEVQTPFSRIHYACGSNLMKSWLNVDFDFRTAPEGYSYNRVNLVRKHPFNDNTFEVGFAEDFIEHLSQADFIIFLSEAYRTFKKGGILRLSFPGLEGACRKHYPTFDLKQVYIGKLEAYSYWDHVHFYSKLELEFLTKKIGFSAIHYETYGNSDVEFLKDIDTRESQIDLTTIVELTK